MSETILQMVTTFCQWVLFAACATWALGHWRKGQWFWAFFWTCGAASVLTQLTRYLWGLQ